MYARSIRNVLLVAVSLAMLMFLGACELPVPLETAAEPATMATPTATPRATPRPYSPISGTLVADTIDSEALSGNLLGDPAERKVMIYLPANYANSDQRYPVAYVLHAQFGSEASMPLRMSKPLEQLIDKGEAHAMILVFPNTQNHFDCPGYLTSPTIGDYESFLVEELVTWIDSSYRTIPSSESRAIVGCDVGADGAFHLALTHPHVFGVVAGMTGTYDYENDPAWNSALASMKRLPKNVNEFPHWSVGLYLSTAAATAPNPDKPPFYLDMPFAFADEKAVIVPEVKQRIVDADVVHDVQRYLAQPDRLNAAMVYHGTLDSYVPVSLGRAFDKYLSDQGVDHLYVEGLGGHCNVASLDYAPVVEFLAENLVSED